MPAAVVLAALFAADASRTDGLGDALPPGAVARLGAARLREDGCALALVYSSDGNRLASIGGGDDAHLWDAASGRLLRTFRASGQVNCLALSPDGRTLAAGANDGTVHLWESATGRKRAVLYPRIDGIYSVAFSQDSNSLAVGAFHGSRFWDVSNPDIPAARPGGPRDDHLKYADKFAFSPDGKTLAGNDISTGQIHLCDAVTHQQQRALSLGETTYCFGFSPDGAVLAVVADHEGGSCTAGCLHLFETATGKERARLDLPSAAHALSFALDGKTLALTVWRGHAVFVLVDLAKGCRQTVFDTGGVWLRSLAFAPDGRTLALGQDDGLIRLWDVKAGKESPIPEGRIPLIDELVYAPDGRGLATRGLKDRDLRLWDPTTGRLRAVLSGHSGTVRGLAWAPDGLTLASCGDATVRLWDPSSAEECLTLRGFRGRGVAFTPDGKELVCYRGDAVRVWEPSGGKERRRFQFDPPADRDAPMSLAPDGKALAVAQVKIDEQTKPQTCLFDLASGKALRSLDDRDDPDRAAALLWSPTGRLLASSCSLNAIVLRDAASGRLVRRMEILSYYGFNANPGLAFSPDGRYLATAGPDEFVRLWDVDAGVLLLRLRGHRGRARAVAFAPDGRFLASAGSEGGALVWDLAECAGRRGPALPRAADDQNWAVLIGADPVRAYRVSWQMTRFPAEAVALARRRLKPAEKLDSKRVSRLLADLDDDRYAVRQAASDELKTLGDWVEEELKQTLADPPSLEVRRRVEDLLRACRREPGDATPEERAASRALALLERLNTPDARRLLQSLSDGRPSARLTREAREACRRLEKRPATP